MKVQLFILPFKVNKMKKYPPILYAEDSKNDVELTMSALKKCNLQNKIDVVFDGHQVLDYLMYKGDYANREIENPILILLDIKMPKLDGIETLKIIKANSDLKSIPVVMLTSSAMENDIAESYQLGVNAYVIKPIGFEEFIFAIKQIGGFWAVVNKTA